MSFSYISHINDVIPYIKDMEEIKVLDKGDYTVINYMVAYEDTFKNPYEKDISSDEKVKRMIVQECRGIIFDKMGNIIRRPWHKFFNINEKNWSSINEIDFNENHLVYEKLDGSMIVPFIVDGTVYWGTKQGNTEISNTIHDFLDQKDNYKLLANTLIKKGISPIFEWCSRLNRIVIDYPESKLVLVGARKIMSGEYLSYCELVEISELYKVPLVKIVGSNIKDIVNFMESAKTLDNEEGYVITFSNGERFKVKGEWYVKIHKNKENFLFEKNVLSVIMEDKIDDLLSFMIEDDKTRFLKYSDEVFHNILSYCDDLKKFIQANTHLTQKDFALKTMSEFSKLDASIVFSARNNVDSILSLVKKTILKNSTCNSNVENVRHIIKAKW